MADAIVMHPDYVHYNPTDPGAYLTGMVVDVFEDGQIGPGNEQHPRFVVIRMPGVPKADVLDLIEAVQDADLNMIKKRGQRVDWSIVPQPRMNDLNNDRETTVTETQFRALMENLT